MLQMKKICLVAFFSIMLMNVFAQQTEGIKNKIIPDPETGEPMLIGYCTRNAFIDTSFSWWFDPEYEMYEPDSLSLDILKDIIDNIDITIVMGTWCDDSRIHVPHLYKILDEINYPTEKITLIAVNEDKKTEGDEIQGLGIDLVPTIIFYNDDSELGRIAETPEESLEEDMVGIMGT